MYEYCRIFLLSFYFQWLVVPLLVCSFAIHQKMICGGLGVYPELVGHITSELEIDHLYVMVCYGTVT